jgi:hypothetical protein
MSKCFICGNDATGVTGDSNVCFSCYSKPKESTLIKEIATDRLEFLKRAEAAEAQLETLTKLNDQYSDDYVRDRDKIIKLEAQVEQYQMYEKMIVASTIQAQEYFDGNVSAKSLGKFREMLHEALEGGE